MSKPLFRGSVLFRRLQGFAAIGGGIFVGGLVVQWLLVNLAMPVIPAYSLQLLLGIGVSYELNRRITWKDRAHSRSSAVFFLVSCLVVAAIGWTAFVVLTHVGVNHLMANALSVVVVTAANYVIGDRWIFRLPKAALIQEEML